MSGFSSKFFAFQSPGKRDYQQDDYGLLDARDSGSEKGEHAVIVVADGMGGHVGGDQASGLATENFIETYQGATGTIPERLRRALAAANAALAASIEVSPELKGMGTTLVAAVVNDAQLYWISVGDSPLWLFRNNALQRLNADHSMTPVLQQMVADGRISQEQAETDPQRHSLLSVLMGETIELTDLRSEPLPLEEKDLVLLASDGLLTLSAEEITAVLAKGADQPVATLVKQLHAAVEAAALPSQDNITITLYRASSEKAVIAEPPTLPLAKRGGSAPPRGNAFRWLLPVCIVLLAIAGMLFYVLRDSAAPAAAIEQDAAQVAAPITPPVVEPPAANAAAATEPAKIPADTAAQPQPETAQNAKPEPQAAALDGNAAPVIEKKPEVPVAATPEQDGTANEKTQ